MTNTPLKNISLTLAALALGLSSIFAAPLARAEEGDNAEESKPAVWLQITPVSNEVTLKPSGDQPLSYTFNVDNLGTETFTYRVYAAPYSVANGTYEVNFASDTPRTQLSRWIDFQDKDGNYAKKVEYTIEPGQKQSIPYRITVPNDIPAGGQYATIFAEADNNVGGSGGGATGINTVSRVGLVLYGRTDGDTKDNAEISNFSLSSFLTGGNIHSSATISNNGNTDFKATYELVVKKFFGELAYEKKVEQDIFPETYYDMSMEWAKSEDSSNPTGGTPAFGIFRVTGKVTALDKVYEETKIVLIIPLFMIIIALVLLTIMIVWLIILIKKRRAQKSRLIV